MPLRLEAVKFNHDPDSATEDAINIRRNETVPVRVPEWRRGLSVNPADSPAAYALCETRGNTLTIQAKFTCADPSVQAVEVRAVDARMTFPSPGSGLLNLLAWLARPLLRRMNRNVLGEVRQKFVFPCEGETEFETFELADVSIWASGVGLHDIAWRWQYRLTPSSPWTDFEVSTHRIYTILRSPTGPWEQDPFADSNTQLPWAEVLDYACNWAAGARDPDEAAARVTRRMNDLGPAVLMFDLLCKGSAYYTTDTKFDCTGFLERLRGGIGKGQYVNCTDCATIVSTFANVVGCDLSQSSMVLDFRLNPHRKIGVPGWVSGGFTFHTVAWEGECLENDELFDASLQVDSDGDFSNLEPLVATNMRFGVIGEQGYRFRLVPRSDECVCVPSKVKKRRTVGLKSRGAVSDDPVLIEFMKRHYLYEKWTHVRPPGDKLFALHFFLNEGEFAGWRQEGTTSSAREGRTTVSQSFWTNLADPERQLIRIDIHECPSIKEARETLLRLLAGFQVHGVRQQSPPEFGDVAFAGAEGCPRLFARANYVIFLRSVGEDSVSLKEVATLIDERLSAKPAQEEEGAYAGAERFRPAAPEAKVGEPVRLGGDTSSTFGQRVTYKFFSPTGEVFLQEDGHLAYTPDKSGTQLIEIYAIDEYGNFISDVLKFAAA